MAFKNYIWDEQFDLNISRGKVRGAQSIHKFGATPSQSTNTTATIWDVSNTLYPWSAFDTPGVLVAAQANVSDNGKVVRVEGLDENWNLTSEEFTLSSSGTVTGTKIFKRAYRAYLLTTVTNVANISFSRGGTEVVRISAEAGQTLMSVFTIPAGCTGYLYQINGSAQASADGTAFLYIRYDTVATTFRTAHTFEINQNNYNYKFTFPLALPEKSDIDLRLTTRSNNGRFTSSFDILLVDEEL